MGAESASVSAKATHVASETAAVPFNSACVASEGDRARGKRTAATTKSKGSAHTTKRAKARPAARITARNLVSITMLPDQQDLVLHYLVGDINQIVNRYVVLHAAFFAE